MTNNFQLAICLLIVIIGSSIAGGAIVGMKLDRVKRQRDEALRQLAEKCDWTSGGKE